MSNRKTDSELRAETAALGMTDAQAGAYIADHRAAEDVASMSAEMEDLSAELDDDRSEWSPEQVSPTEPLNPATDPITKPYIEYTAGTRLRHIDGSEATVTKDATAYNYGVCVENEDGNDELWPRHEISTEPRYIVRGTDHAQEEPDTISRPEICDTKTGSSVSGPWALNDWDRAQIFADELNRIDSGTDDNETLIEGPLAKMPADEIMSGRNIPASLAKTGWWNITTDHGRYTVKAPDEATAEELAIMKMDWSETILDGLNDGPYDSQKEAEDA